MLWCSLTICLIIIYILKNIILLIAVYDINMLGGGGGGGGGLLTIRLLKWNPKHPKYKWA